MQPVISKTIIMDKDGTLVLPKAILDLYEMTDAIELKIQLMANGTIEIIPQLDVPKSFYLKAYPQLKEAVARIYVDAEQKRYVSEDEIEQMLDQTEQQKVATESALNSMIIQSMNTMAVAVSIIDATGTLVYYNKQAARVLDRKPEYIGTDIRSHHKKAASNATIDQMLAEFKDGRTDPIYYEAKPYGKPIAVTVSPIFDGNNFIGCTQTVRPVDDE